MLHVFLINLDRSPDRLHRMAGEFQRIGLAFQRLSATEGTNLSEGAKPYFCDATGRIVSTLYPGRVGAIGCYASHLAIWQQAVSGDHGPAILICEDDLTLPDDLGPLIDEVLKAAPPGWDVIRLSSPTKRKFALLAQLSEGRSSLTASAASLWQAPI